MDNIHGSENGILKVKRNKILTTLLYPLLINKCEQKEFIKTPSSFSPSQPTTAPPHQSFLFCIYAVSNPTVIVPFKEMHLTNLVTIIITHTLSLS